MNDSSIAVNMFNLFSNKPLLNEGTTQWLFEAYAWALSNFGYDFFYEDTILVTPTKTHFPSLVNSRQSMANSIFEQMIHYAGMQNWPLELIELTADYEPVQPSNIIFNGIPRGPATTISLEGATQTFHIIYTADLTRDPSALTTVIARQLASHLVGVSNASTPGGDELHDHLVDLLAIFMGFGLFLTNNAIMIQRGCSGCGKSVQATGFLSEDQMTYTLAIFCCLKKIPNKVVLPHLKKALHPLFKKAMKEINGNNKTERLTQITHPIKSTSNAV